MISVDQDYLSAGMAGFAQLVCGRGLGDRECRRYRYPQPALAGERDRDREAMHRQRVGMGSHGLAGVVGWCAM
jgi:hypothetical protein